MASNPAVVTDHDLAGELDVVSTTADLGLVRGGKNGHTGPERDAGAHLNQTAVQDAQIEVGKGTITPADIAAIVNLKGRFDEGIIAQLADDLSKHFHPFVCQSLEVGIGYVVREPVIVLVDPGTGFEAGGFQLGRE